MSISFAKVLSQRLMTAAAIAATALSLQALPQAAQAQKTLTVVMHADLKIVDPIWTRPISPVIMAT